jgi:hypothetical protein
MKEICRIVFRGILAYCVNELQIDSDNSYPNMDDDSNQSDDVFCTLLYNDETHTFDQVSAFNLSKRILSSNPNHHLGD